MHTRLNPGQNKYPGILESPLSEDIDLCIFKFPLDVMREADIDGSGQVNLVPSLRFIPPQN